MHQEILLIFSSSYLSEDLDELLGSIIAGSSTKSSVNQYLSSTRGHNTWNSEGECRSMLEIGSTNLGKWNRCPVNRAAAL